MRRSVPGLAAAALLGGAGLLLSPAAPRAMADESKLPLEPKPALEPVLRTEQFERGEVRMPDVADERLEEFLRDLTRRRDYDLSQHQGRPGPDHAYLTRWIRTTLDELAARGYYFDRYGDLRRPGTVVPVR